jgi:hypothetical protein
MIRRILPCVLVLFVLLTAACGWFGTQPPSKQNTNSAPATNVRKKIDFSEAEHEVRDALKKMEPATGSPESKISQVREDVAAAISKLNLKEERVTACECPEAIGEAKAAQQLLTTVLTAIGNNSKKVSEVNAELKNEIQTNLEQAANKLQDATRSAANAVTPSPSPSPSESATTSAGAETGQNTDPTVELLVFAAKVVGGVLILALVGFGLLHLRNQSRQHLQHHLGKVAAANSSVTRESQKEILDKLASLSSAQNDTNTRLHEVHTEIRTLARLVRETSPSRGDGRSYASIASSSSYSYNDPSPPKEEPEFPVFAGDYIDKMTRYSNVVKPDFQNGILINDPEGRGELMLIRDSRVPDETQPLFVVPRHAQFQTPQDFYTYYEKYYDCMKPGAGEVWIIDPAVVEKVSGGWLLREKGVLEIR